LKEIWAGNTVETISRKFLGTTNPKEQDEKIETKTQLKKTRIKKK